MVIYTYKRELRADNNYNTFLDADRNSYDLLCAVTTNL